MQLLRELLDLLLEPAGVAQRIAQHEPVLARRGRRGRERRGEGATKGPRDALRRVGGCRTSGGGGTACGTAYGAAHDTAYDMRRHGV